MKKAVLIFIIIVVSIWCTGCMLLSEIEKFNDDTVAINCAKDVVVFINEKDTEGIIDRFSTVVKDSKDLEAQINDLYLYLDGKIVSYDDYIPVTRGQSTDNGKIILHTLSPTLNNVKTENSDDIFRIDIYAHEIDIEKPQHEGIWLIQIRKIYNNGSIIQNDGLVVGDPELY